MENYANAIWFCDEPIAIGNWFIEITDIAKSALDL